MFKLFKAYFESVPAARSKFGLVMCLSVLGALFQGASVGVLMAFQQHQLLTLPKE